MIHNRIPSEHRAVRQMQRAWDTPKIAVCPDSGCACCSLKSQYPQIVMSLLFESGDIFSSPILKKRQKNVRCIVDDFLEISHSFFRTKGKNMSVCYSVISTFITKSLLTFFRELHILTVRKLMFPFFEPNLFPLLEGGRLIFYTFVRIGENRFLPMQSHQNRTQC